MKNTVLALAVALTAITGLASVLGVWDVLNEVAKLGLDQALRRAMKERPKE
jgi:hypothetical protein